MEFRTLLHLDLLKTIKQNFVYLSAKSLWNLQMREVKDEVSQCS